MHIINNTAIENILISSYVSGSGSKMRVGVFSNQPSALSDVADSYCQHITTVCILQPYSLALRQLVTLNIASGTILL